MFTNEQLDFLVDAIGDRLANRVMDMFGDRIPTILSILMQNVALRKKMTEDFYKANPEFKQHRDIVALVLSNLEGNNLTDDIKDILAEAKPLIKEMIADSSKGIDYTKVTHELPKPEHGSNGVL